MLLVIHPPGEGRLPQQWRKEISNPTKMLVRLLSGACANMPGGPVHVAALDMLLSFVYGWNLITAMAAAATVATAQCWPGGMIDLGNADSAATGITVCLFLIGSPPMTAAAGRCLMSKGSSRSNLC